MNKIIEHPYCIAHGHDLMEVAYVLGEFGFVCRYCGISRVDLLNLYTIEETGNGEEEE